MDQLKKKEHDVSRGLHYRYYVSPASKADTSKPTLVLLHGWPDSADLWQFVVPHLLKTKCRLVIPDLLGAGGTSKPTDPAQFQVKKMSNDIIEILKTEGISQNIIPMGHDWGAYLAQRLYMHHKSSMSGLITLSVTLMAPHKEPFDLDSLNAQTEATFGYPIWAYWELLSDPQVGKVVDPNLESLWYACHGDGDGNTWMKKLFCTRGELRNFLSAGRTDVPLKPYAENDVLKKAWLEEKGQEGITSHCAWYRAMREDFQLETEKELDGRLVEGQPYLFIGCDGDAVCRTDFVGLAVQRGAVREKDLEVKELESGHWVPFERPDEIGEIVVEWLGKKGFLN